ncbi:MAG: MerR family transcriptional regulator [Thermomicrobiales bacterium]|nr:MerR family transcriptional regulator [Thermomicrobiales bacterium]
MKQLWTIQEVAKAAGTTSRTLRHYDAIGLLPPASLGENGYRLYDAAALIRLQRILALRNLGLGLPDIARVLDDGLSAEDALAALEQQLLLETTRLERQIASIRRTRIALQKGRSPMTENMFDGFQHEQYKEEVEERWGADAYARSDAWWKSKSDAEKLAWQQKLSALNNDWQDAVARGVDVTGEEAQALAARHVDWLRDLPQAMVPDDFGGYILGLGEMYVNDPRFATNYSGEVGATFVRDALKVYVETNL